MEELFSSPPSSPPSTTPTPPYIPCPTLFSLARRCVLNNMFLLKRPIHIDFCMDELEEVLQMQTPATLKAVEAANPHLIGTILSEKLWKVLFQKHYPHQSTQMVVPPGSIRASVAGVPNVAFNGRQGQNGNQGRNDSKGGHKKLGNDRRNDDNSNSPQTPSWRECFIQAEQAKERQLVKSTTSLISTLSRLQQQKEANRTKQLSEMPLTKKRARVDPKSSVSSFKSVKPEVSKIRRLFDSAVARDARDSQLIHTTKPTPSYSSPKSSSTLISSNHRAQPHASTSTSTPNRVQPTLPSRTSLSSSSPSQRTPTVLSSSSSPLSRSSTTLPSSKQRTPPPPQPKKRELVETFRSPPVYEPRRPIAKQVKRF